jgi:transposase
MGTTSGGIPTEAMVAHVLVARYADHLPLYRQAQILERQGVIVERSTLSFWMGYAAAEVAPVVARLREMMLASTRIFADETVVPVLDPGRGRTKQGYFWAMARDDRPWAGDQPPAVVYSYGTRPRTHPRPHAAWWLPRYPSVRWLSGLQKAWRLEVC